METINITVSKKKIILLISGSLMFVFLGIWLVTNFSGYKQIAGMAAILFFGIGLIIFPRKLFDKTPGLTINEDGITDNITKPHVGLIEWKDITGFEIIRIYSNKMLLIFVENPEIYLDKIKNKQVNGLRNNYNMVGTPFVIPSGILDIKIDNLMSILSEYLQEIKSNPHLTD